MFTLENTSSKYLNYLKYLILLGDFTHIEFLGTNDFYYYLIAKGVYFTLGDKILFKLFNIKSYTLPVYFICLYFYISSAKANKKFNLSKLGTDYIFNKVPMHFKSECTGSYPNNYVFIKEPLWPESKKYRTDRTPLKNFNGMP